MLDIHDPRTPTPVTLHRKVPLQLVQSILLTVIAVLVVLVVMTRLVAPAVDGQRVASKIYVVQRGDTLLSIAEAVDPQMNPYPIVAKLLEQTHGTVIFPGERIVVPTPSH